MRFLTWAICLFVLVGCASAEAKAPQPAANGGPDYMRVAARVVPYRQASMSFQVNGQIASWAVEPGALVKQDQPLAQLDTRQLQLDVREAEANLAKSQSALQTVESGATSEQVAAAEARLGVAVGRQKSVAGAVSPADTREAAARLTAARAKLALLQAGPRPDLKQTTQSQRDQAQAALNTAVAAASATATNASALKVAAEAAVQQAANDLRAAQDQYSTAKWQNEKAAAGSNPNTGVRVTASEKQSFQNAFNTAERNLADMDRALETARVAYEQARQAELTQTTQAQQTVASAQAALEGAEAALTQVLKGATAAEITAAEADVAAAQAARDSLSGAGRSGDLTVAQSQVAEAQADLSDLKRGPTEAMIASAQAGVAAAQTTLDQAKLQFELATLRAPFDGVVGQRLIEVGEQVEAGKAVAMLGDQSRWLVKTQDLSELEVGRLQPGQKFKVTIDALPDKQFEGVVVRVDPQPQIARGETSYTLLLDLAVPANITVRWDMSARILMDVHSS